MKITGIKSWLFDAYRTNLAFVKVETDGGVHGYGEVSIGQFENAIIGMVKDLEPKIVGRDPQDVESIWHDANRDSYWRGGPVLGTALAGIEMACWDIKGKILEQPVWQLLGGKHRDRVRCYANAWFVGAKTPGEFGAKAKSAKALGWKALKWDPFGSLYRDINSSELEASISCVAAVREAVGSGVDLMIECHGRFNFEASLRIAHHLEEFDILWLEEPLFPELQYTMPELRRKVRVPLAAGERIYNRYQAMDFIGRGCADFIQPDISRVGIKEIRTIAGMAEAAGVGFCPHNPNGPLTNAATLQIAACTPNFFMLETMANDVPWRSEISDEEIYLVDGEMKIPERPGLGIELNEGSIERYPPKLHPLRHYHGTLTEIRPEDAKEWFAKKNKI
jgi:galactonate dehydratase